MLYAIRRPPPSDVLAICSGFELTTWPSPTAHMRSAGVSFDLFRMTTHKARGNRHWPSLGDEVDSQSH